MSNRVARLLARLNQEAARFGNRFEVQGTYLLKSGRSNKENSIREFNTEDAMVQALIGELQFVKKLR